MASTAGKTVPDEAKLSALLLHKRVLTEGQLKAALDYQRSRGGRLFDVLVKLELIREQSLDQLLARLAQEEKDGAESEADDSVLSPDSVNVAELKVHRRLLDKVPEDVVKEYLFVLFFPSGNLSLRRIILGHGREIPSDLAKKIGSLLGVDLYTLRLDLNDAISFLQDCGRAELISDIDLDDEEEVADEDPFSAAEADIEERRGKAKQKGLKSKATSPKQSRSRKKTTSSAQTGKRVESSGGSEALLRALVSLLAKKGLISREEFEAELEDAG